MLSVGVEEHVHDKSWIGPAPWIENPPPGVRARELLERDHAVTTTSYTRDYPLVARRAFGSVVEDVDGNRYLDFAAGIAVCATGHCHPRVVAAIHEQSAQLIHICGSDFYYEPLVLLAEKLAALAPGDSPKRVFLTNSGTEAVEAAIKLARFHTNRKWILAFHGAFHGRTMGALALTSSKVRQKAGFGPLIPMVAHVPYGRIDEIVGRVFEEQAAPSEIAAVFVEPIQGEGGYVFPPPDFLPRLRELCTQHGILLVCDEIQSGMGRTGRMWACEHVGVVPDILLTAKGIASGLPLGAVIAPASIMNWPPGAQGSTFGGNPVACAAALATIELIEGGLMANATTMGAVMLEGLRKIAGERPCIVRPRGLGLMTAVDIVDPGSGKPDPKLRQRLLVESFERGLILLGCGHCAVRFIPPLCINATQVDVGLNVFDEAVATVME